LMVHKSEVENSINAPSRSPQSPSNNTHNIAGANNLGVSVYTILQDDMREKERERSEVAAAERERERMEEDARRAAEAKARSEALAVWERQKAASMQQAHTQLHSSPHTTVPPSSFYPPNSPSDNFTAPSQTSSFVHSGTPGVCIHQHDVMYIHEEMHTNKHVLKFIHTHTHTHQSTQAHTHTYTNTHTHTHTHTHSLTRSTCLLYVNGIF
jgi:hypothetical protein